MAMEDSRKRGAKRPAAHEPSSSFIITIIIISPCITIIIPLNDYFEQEGSFCEDQELNVDEDIEDNNNTKDAKMEEGGLVQTDNTPRAPTGKKLDDNWLIY